MRYCRSSGLLTWVFLISGLQRYAWCVTHTALWCLGLCLWQNGARYLWAKEPEDIRELRSGWIWNARPAEWDSSWRNGQTQTCPKRDYGLVTTEWDLEGPRPVTSVLPGDLWCGPFTCIQQLLVQLHTFWLYHQRHTARALSCCWRLKLQAILREVLSSFPSPVLHPCTLSKSHHHCS